MGALQGWIRSNIPSPDGSRITWEEAHALALTLPLGRELVERDSTDEAWNRANVGRFISCVGVVNRRHHNEMWNEMNDVRWYSPRQVDRSEVETATATYLIAATDPRWLTHLAPGMEWDSTAYDHDEKVVFDPAWRTPTVMALAKQIDESGDFELLPILADALQDAGCAAEQLLGHCRGPGPHARRCCVVDQVLCGRFDPRTLDVADVSQVDVEFWPDTAGDADRLPGPSSVSVEDIAAIIAAVRSAQEITDDHERARGVIRFTRRSEEATELMFYPGRNPKRYEVRTAGRAYRIDRGVFRAALRRIGADLPRK